MEHKFKIGDEVWCVEACDFSHRSSDAEISLTASRGNLKDVSAQQGSFIVMNELGYIVSDENFQNFPSKNEAIDYMIKELEGMRDE